MYGIIYVITNTINGKQYVGQTTLTLKKRWGWPLRYGPETLTDGICGAIRKYTPQSFTIEQIDSAESLSKLNEKEVYHIARLGTYGGGYNLTIGGEGVPNPSSGVRERMSRAVQFRPPISRETRLKKSTSNTGKHAASSETRSKLSIARKNQAPFHKTFCPKGHLYDDINTYVTPSTGGRQCLTCFYLRAGRKVPSKLLPYLDKSEYHQ